MFLLRLVRLVFFWMVARWVFQAVRRLFRQRTVDAKRSHTVHEQGAQPSDYSRLTEQGVDDADFEEIP